MDAVTIESGPQHMLALEQANRVRLARRFRGCACMPVGDREHDRERAADEPEEVGTDSLPEVSDVDRTIGDENCCKPYRAAESHSGRASYE